jgi:hypothetical protein
MLLNGMVTFKDHPKGLSVQDLVIEKTDKHKEELIPVEQSPYTQEELDEMLNTWRNTGKVKDKEI